MKLVFNLDEVANALGQTTEEFINIRARLESVGFPKPVRGFDDRWAIMEVISWVNHEGASDGGGFAEVTLHDEPKLGGASAFKVPVPKSKEH